MLYALAGLLFSRTPMLNIITAFMAFAVLFDTFVVRAFLIPPLMHAIGDVNWWPMRYPVVPGLNGDTVALGKSITSSG